MKKLIFICIAVILSISLTACSSNESYSEVKEDTPSMFVQVENGYSWEVYYHKDTKVMYVVSEGYYNAGTFTVMVNPDGTPMLWEG